MAPAAMDAPAAKNEGGEEASHQVGNTTSDGGTNTLREEVGAEQGQRKGGRHPIAAQPVQPSGPKRGAPEGRRKEGLQR